MVQAKALTTREDNLTNFISPSEGLTQALPCEKFRLSLNIKSLTILPPYKGGIFRGAFGNAFRHAVCAMRATDCDACLLKSQCLYVALFQPPPPEGYKDAGKYNHAPPPYVLNPPLDNRQAFQPGDILTFDLVLMGRAIDALPYFIYSFIEMGKRGLGRERGRYELTGVDLIRKDASTTIYDGNTQTLKNFDKGDEPAPDNNEEIKRLTIRFLTPLRLKEKNNLVTSLTFPLFFERLAHRLELLSAFYGTNGPINVPDTLMEQTENIQTKSEQLHWYEWERYSSRQKDLMKLGGLKGEIAFEGSLAPFMPYIRLAEMVNVGQGTSFGLGKVEATTYTRHDHAKKNNILGNR